MPFWVALTALFVDVAVSAAIAYGSAWLAGQLARKPKRDHRSFGNMPFQTAEKGGCVSKVYGTVKIAGNIIWSKDEGQFERFEGYYVPLKSFLVHVCEGPASVQRIWLGKTMREVGPRLGAGVYLFDGAGNVSGGYHPSSHPVKQYGWNIRDLTGEDFGDYPNSCCVFFYRRICDISGAVPEYLFEVSSGRSTFFVGMTGHSSDYAVMKVRSDGTVDTSWGTNGGFTYTDPDTSAKINTCYDLYQMPDGRLLVSHNILWIEDNSFPNGKLITLTMLTENGAIDTSWGYNGHYVVSQTGAKYAFSAANKILRDDDGNFILLANDAYSLHKMDSNGTTIYARSWTEGPGNARCQIFRDAVWVNNKTRIIAVGSFQNSPAGGIFNVMALDPETGDADTTWPGNMSEAGYAQVWSGVSFPTTNAEWIKMTSDGGFVIAHGYGTDTTNYYSTSKLDSDGVLDTSFGNSGRIATGWPHAYQKAAAAQSGDRIYTLARHRFPYEQDDNKTQITSFNGLTGRILQTYDSVSWSSDQYHAMAIMGGMLWLGTRGSASDATYFLERWTQNLNYIDGLDLSGFTNSDRFYVIQPMSTETVPFDVNPAAIINDLVTHNRYGAGSVGVTLNAAKLAAAENYWGSKGILLSLHLNEQRPLTDWIDYILSQCDGFRSESGGQLCLGVFRDEDPVFEITADDWLRSDEANPTPPVNIAERPPSDTYNEVIVACTDRDNDYAESYVVAKDKLSQRDTGVRKRTIDMKGIYDPALAQIMAYRALIKSLYTFHSFTGSVPYMHMLIENGDVGLISDGGKIVRRKVRVLKIEEDINGRGLDLTMIEDEARHHPTIGYLPQPNLSTPAATVTLADGTIAFREDADAAKLYLSVAPGGAYTNGFKVYRSYDDSSFEFVGRATIDGVTGGDGNSTGTIQGNLAAHPAMTWAKDESVQVSIGTVTDLHTDITEDQFWSDRRLAKIGDEIIAFKDAVETAVPGIWTISNLRRGCFGTEAAAHTAGETFSTLDSNFTYSFDQADIGRTLYFKALAFYGNDEVQEIDDVSSVSVVIGGYYQRPAAASLLRLTSDENDGGSGEYSGSSFTLYWNLGSRVSGWNYGGWDVSGGGVPWNNYTEDDDLQNILLKFEQSDSTPIGQRSIAVGEQATITKATDLGGYNPARVRVVPRRVLESRLKNSLLVDDGS